MTKYQQYFNLMLEKNAADFKEFSVIHDAYVLDPQKNQDAFNQKGYEIQDIITEYENRLCHYSEKGEFGKYSHTLSEKFRELVRQKYPKIDDVGVEIEIVAPPPKATRPPAPRFTPRKRRLLLDQTSDEIIQDALDDTLNSLKKIKL